MRKQTLTLQQDIHQQLSLLCLDTPKICEKKGNVGIISNDRVIVVREGRVQYYRYNSSYPSPQYSMTSQAFKGAVKMTSIQQVNFLPKNSFNQDTLQIIFPSPSLLTEYNPGANSLAEQQPPQGQKVELTKWRFQFTFNIKEFIENRMEEQIERQRMKSRIENSPPPPHASGVNNSMVQRSILDPYAPNLMRPVEQDVGEVKKERNIQTYVQAVHKTRQFLKKKAELAQEEAIRQKRKQEQELSQTVNLKNQNLEQTFALSSFWRDYFKYYEHVMKKEGSRIAIMETQVIFLQQVDYFNQRARAIVQSYVDEWCMGVSLPKKTFQDFQYYQGVWLKTGGKELNQEFLVNYYLNDILYSLREVKGLNFRLPLMTLFKYKGVKVLVMCDMPFSELEKTEVYNLSREGLDLQVISKMRECLELLEDVLNVKSQEIQINHRKNKIKAPLGPNLKIFEYTFKKDRNQDQATLPNFYYLISPGKLFPLDFNSQKQVIKPLARLRPEVVALFRDYHKQEDTQLLVQSFMRSTMPQSHQQREDLKAIKASTLIHKYCVPALMQKLDRLELMLVDSYSISQAMHEMGINIRYLNLLHSTAALPYVKELIHADIIARILKKLFRSSLKDIAHSHANNQQYIDEIRDQTSKVERMRQIKEDGIDKYNEIAVDFLNLVFGKGPETVQFWKIVDATSQDKFGVESPYTPPIKPRCLLNAVLWHCGLTAKITHPLPLFQVDQPFQGVQGIEFEVRQETFDFPSFELQKVFRYLPTLEDKMDFEMFKMASQKLNRLQMLHHRTLALEQSDWGTLTTLSKLNNYRQYLAKPGNPNQMHPILITHYLTNKSEANYQQALQILTWSLPDTHPLFISLYLEYAPLFQPQLMKQTALLMAVRGLGEWHPKCIELYSKFYEEGMTELKIKAQRVQTVEACSKICRQLYDSKTYETCLQFSWEQMSKINSKNSHEKLGAGNYQQYLSILLQGLDSAIQTVQLSKGITLSQQITRVASSFKYEPPSFTQDLFEKVVRIHCLQSRKKYFIYKLVLLTICIHKKHSEVRFDEQQMALPVQGEQRIKILEGLAVEYYSRDNHSNWVDYILKTLLRAFQYFNFLEDLFNNYAKHFRTYNDHYFTDCFGYLDLLVRIYGQRLFKQSLYDIRYNGPQ